MKNRVLQILSVGQNFLSKRDDFFSGSDWIREATEFDPGQIYRSLNKLVKDGALTKDLLVKSDRSGVYSLVDLAWDSQWRLVTYDIAERHRKVRRYIRKYLQSLGFRQWQRSVWLCTLPVEDFVGELAKKYLLADISLFVGKIYHEDSKEIASQLWLVNDWEERAERMVKKISKTKSLTTYQKACFWDLILNHPKVAIDLLSAKWPLRKLLVSFTDKIAQY